MTKVYFVRHAQPEHEWEEDRTRPLTEEGKKDSVMVLDFFKHKKIDTFLQNQFQQNIFILTEKK